MVDHPTLKINKLNMFAMFTALDSFCFRTANENVEADRIIEIGILPF